MDIYVKYINQSEYVIIHKHNKKPPSEVFSFYINKLNRFTKFNIDNYCQTLKKFLVWNYNYYSLIITMDYG